MGQTATDYARDRISNLRLLSDLVQETGFDGTDYLPVPRMDVSQSRYFRPKKKECSLLLAKRKLVVSAARPMAIRFSDHFMCSSVLRGMEIFAAPN